MNTNTIARTANATQIHALLDLNEPAKLFRTPVQIEVEVREPDFVDVANSTAVWIGADAAVELPTDLLADLPELMRRSGWLARTRRYPSECGVRVTPHNATYRHPAGQSLAYSAWRTVTDALAGANA
jgi:hypothetical protein